MKLPENACLLTFDDGYIDHYLTVFPILMNRHIRGFFSMPGRILEERKLLDVNKIHYILASTDYEELWDAFRSELLEAISNYHLPKFEEYWEKCNLESRFDPPELIFIKRMLQVELPLNVRAIIIDRLYGRFVAVPENVMVRELYMSREQMLCMKNAGMVFGIHGYEHAWLNCMSEDEAEYDIIKALDAMDGIVDSKGWIMCYPYGSYSKPVEDIAKKHGAAMGFVTTVGVVDTEKDSIFKLPRWDTNDFPPKSENYKHYITQL